MEDEGSVERNYYVNESGRLQLNTPLETGDLYEMSKVPRREGLAFS